MDSILKDLRYAVRSLVRYPTFTIVAVMTLALGIGANTAIFTVVNAVLLRPLPYTSAERLMMIGISTPSVKLFNTSKNRFFFWRQQSKSFEGLTTFRTFSGPLVNSGYEPDYVTGLRVSEDFFQVFATYPRMGRSFSNEENLSDGPKVVILTDTLWKRYFGAAPDVVDKQLPIRNIRTMEQVIATSIAPQRFHMSLLALFGGIGLALSSVGIYGVMAYSVSQRTREIGIRMALGAQMRDVLRMVIGHGIKLTLIGVVIGLAGSFALTRALKALLFGVTPTDLTTFAVVSAALVMIALLASYIPARRATKVDPLVALRYE